MLRLKQILTLKSEGNSNREIARLLSIHRETVRSYVNEAMALGLSVASMSELPPSWGFCADIGKQHAGVVSGNLNMAGNMGAFFTALAFPYLLARAGSASVFIYVAAGLNVIAVFIWLQMDPRKEMF